MRLKIIFSRNNSIQPLTIKRNNDVPVINMIITPDTEVCNETMEYIYTWTIYDAMDESGYNVGNIIIYYIT